MYGWDEGNGGQEVFSLFPLCRELCQGGLLLSGLSVPSPPTKCLFHLRLAPGSIKWVLAPSSDRYNVILGKCEAQESAGLMHFSNRLRTSKLQRLSGRISFGSCPGEENLPMCIVRNEGVFYQMSFKDTVRWKESLHSSAEPFAWLRNLKSALPYHGSCRMCLMCTYPMETEVLKSGICKIVCILMLLSLFENRFVSGCACFLNFVSLTFEAY